MYYTKKQALKKIGVGLVLGLLSFFFICQVDESLRGAWFGLGSGLLFIMSAIQVAVGIDRFNNS